MPTLEAFHNLYRDVVYKNLHDGSLAGISNMPGTYLLALYPQRFDPKVLWGEVQNDVRLFAGEFGIPNPRLREKVEHAYGEAAYDLLSSREYVVTNNLSEYIPAPILAQFEAVENGYTEFVHGVGPQYFWAKFDEVTSMLVTGIYLLVAYPYLTQAFYEIVAQDEALHAGCMSILGFLREVFV